LCLAAFAAAIARQSAALAKYPGSYLDDEYSLDHNQEAVLQTEVAALLHRQPVAAMGNPMAHN